MDNKEKLVEFCKHLHRNGLIAGADGNISIKLNENEILATPSKRNKGFITEEDILKADFSGKLIEGKGKVTSEISMHTMIYRKRSDVNAVIHTHAPYSTAFAAAGQTIPDNILIEIAVIIGRIGLADFSIPGTADVPKSIEPFIEDCNAIILKHHGVVVYGADIEEAYNRLESLEGAAKSIILSRLLGNGSPLPFLDQQTVNKMYEYKK